VIISSYAIKAEHAFIYIRGEVVHVLRPPAGGGPRGLRRGLLGTDILGSATTSSSPCTRAPAPTSAARRPRCSTRSRATAGSRGCAAVPAVAGSTAARPVINNVESIASVPPDRAARRPSGSARWARRSRRVHAVLAVRATCSARASTKRRSASPCASCSSSPVGVRPGHELKFWTPGGSSTPLLHRRSTSTCRSTTRASAAPARCWAPRPCRSSTRPPASCARCCAGRSSTPRVVRQVHPVP
jgi:NADH-quinone oxidoreductase subunit F